MPRTLRKIIAANSAIIGTDGSDFDSDSFIAFTRENDLIPDLPDRALDADDFLDFSLGDGTLFDIAERFGVKLMVGGPGVDQLGSNAGAFIFGGGGNDGGFVESGVAFGGSGNDSFGGPGSFIHGGPGSDLFRAHDGMVVADLTPDDTLDFSGTASYRDDLVFEGDGQGNTIVRYEVLKQDDSLLFDTNQVRDEDDSLDEDTGSGRAEFIREEQEVVVIGIDPGDFDPATIVAPTEDDYPADTSTTGFIPLDGTKVTGEIEVQGDVDWFRVELTAGETYEFDFSEDPPQLSGVFYTSSGALIRVPRDTLIDSFDVQSAEGGTYYLGVAADDLSIGAYEISAVATDDAPELFI